jgi:hypothetical protein
MKNYLQKFSKISAITVFAMCVNKVNAQISISPSTLTYMQDFNSLDTTNVNSSNLPTGWSIFEYGTAATVNNQYKGNNGSSNSGDTYSYGQTGSTNRSLGTLLSGSNSPRFGAKFVNNTGATITSIAVNYTGKQWRRGNVGTNVDSLLFKYSTTATDIADTASSLWINHSDLTLSSIYTQAATASGLALNGDSAVFSITKTGIIPVNIAPNQTLCLAWIDYNITGTDDGLSIDDLSITFTTNSTPIITNILLTDKTPTGNNIALTTNTLTAKYDHAIAAGTGNIELYKVGTTTPVLTVDVTSTDVTIADSTATISGVVLENASAGAFTKTGGTLPSLGLSDNTTWAFATVDTVTPPPPTPLTTLNETFTNCTNEAMGVFVQYSVTGAKTWRCSTFGRNDSAAVYINGGSATGVSEANEDWLISKAPFNFSALQKPVLSFWQKQRFTGEATRALKVSTNYVPGTNPNDATWTTIPIQALTAQPGTDWNEVKDIDLTAHKATPFYIAMTYTCGTEGTYELTYDDIKVAEGIVGIADYSRGSLSLQVLGDATANQINLGVSLKEAAPLQVEVYDITGRKVQTAAFQATAGKGTYVLQNGNLRAGMYIIKVSNGTVFGSVKAMVK